MTKHMTNRDLHSLLLVEPMVYDPEDDDCCRYVFKKQSRQETKMYGRMPPDVFHLRNSVVCRRNRLWRKPS